jgi:hypothetical protein
MHPSSQVSRRRGAYYRSMLLPRSQEERHMDDACMSGLGIEDIVQPCTCCHASSLPWPAESCKSALEYDAQLRAADVRLDARFRAACSADVRSLCFAEEANVRRRKGREGGSTP